MKLCKVINMNGETIIPEQDIQLTPFQELILLLQQPYNSAEEMEQAVNQQFIITKQCIHI